MSNLTYGPPVVLDEGHRPVAPPHSLLSTPGVLKGTEAHWLSGATVYPYPQDLPGLWDPCSAGTFREKDEGTGVTSPSFASFVVYLPITCSAMGMGGWEEFRGRAEIAMDAIESFAVEEQLAMGTGIATNPFFGDAALDILASGSAVTPAVGLSYLEDAIGETGKQGMIHATPSVVSQWYSGTLFAEPLRTINGTRVVSGGGYIGADPSAGSTASAGQSWAFATGPVEVRHSEVALMDIAEVLDRSNNDVTFRAERYVLATWDTQLQAGVLIDWSP